MSQRWERRPKSFRSSSRCPALCFVVDCKITHTKAALRVMLCYPCTGHCLYGITFLSSEPRWTVFVFYPAGCDRSSLWWSKVYKMLYWFFKKLWCVYTKSEFNYLHAKSMQWCPGDANYINWVTQLNVWYLLQSCFTHKSKKLLLECEIRMRRCHAS